VLSSFIDYFVSLFQRNIIASAQKLGNAIAVTIGIYIGLLGVSRQGNVA
jgi:hypothetical protein